VQSESNHKIIGGMFGLPHELHHKKPIDPGRWLFLNNSNLFLANARSGIWILIDQLKPRNVWMPSYLCPTMVHAVNKEKTNLRFYEIDYDLKIASMDWINHIQTNDLVIIIDYFGFPLNTKVTTAIKEQGGWILEDACQAMLSQHVGNHSDFVLFSPRKFIGVPEGGILASCCDIKFQDIQLHPTSISWWLKMLEATISRREFDRYGRDHHWYKLFRKNEAESPCGYYAMSELSRNLLFSSFDYLSIARHRINNYSLLVSELKEYALFPVLPKGTVPLGFPVRNVDRDQVRNNLFKKKIYPPVHWAIDGVVPSEFRDSLLLADHIMTLVCDQRYIANDMLRIVDNFK